MPFWRSHLLGALGVALLAYWLARNRRGELAMLIAAIFVLASCFYFLQGDRLETISEYSAATKDGENTESIDGTKGAVRDFFATDPRSLSHLLLTPVRFVAYIIAPFPTGGALQATAFTYEIGPNGYAPYMAMLSRVSFYSIIALLLAAMGSWRRIRASSLMMVAMFISGLIFASLYSPFLHQRYRIPFLPLLFLAARMNGIHFGRRLVWVIMVSEILSAVLFFTQAYLAEG
jgi:4-amino-4-deoxy-L-arabinose transferase-like glycosyltransferase